MNDTPADLVFVYGTLRRRGSNHREMAGAIFLCEATVIGNLYQIAWYPGAILQAESTQVIVGEIFRVSASHMPQLDAYEGEEYRRVRVKAHTAEGETFDAWIWEYTKKVDRQRIIASGDWLQYTKDSSDS